jgi:HSP20 family protein
MTVFSLLATQETTELADDIRRLFDELARTLPHDQRAYPSECHPALDVLETDENVQVTVDVAGVPAAALRVLFRAGLLLVVGEKAPLTGAGEHAYHLVEREFGRFARAVRLDGAFNVPAARATLHDGELTIVLPKIQERRGAGQRIAITPATEPQQR